MAPVRRPMLPFLGLLIVGCGLFLCLGNAFTNSLFASSSRIDAAADLASKSKSSFGGGRRQRPGLSALHSSAELQRQRIRLQAGGQTEGFDLTGKVAIVTGASRGIGEAIAEKLAKAGATVIGTATSDSGASAISGRFEGDLKGEGMKLDVTNGEEVEAVLNAVTEKYGAPDILVNNAGITKDTLMMRMKEAQWDDVINTNLNSVFRMTKVATKGMMKKKWGRIISISSVVGSMGNMGQTNYAAAKAGMEGFTRAYAREVGSRGITVNAVAPGFIATDMTDGLPEDWKAKLLESVPAGRLGTPAEIADSVLFLASPAAAYVTGHTLHVNGGMYMR
eukprot:TRINITY_DN8752_c2_g1_i1.p1 TRINITY_DN8752_c2_g1~~TRINITY_DN8752_c2_g1_i1.p1  ORF type:complete len:358 (-),score=82.10 TRINITY_DN8752_c2_g1_i1:443-1447(-)